MVKLREERMLLMAITKNELDSRQIACPMIGRNQPQKL